MMIVIFENYKVFYFAAKFNLINSVTMKKNLIGISIVALAFLGFKAHDTNVKEESTANAHLNIELKQDIAKGKETYTKVCGACHQPTGAGVPNAFPPLAGSDYLNKDVNRAISAVLKGLNTEITVNGAKYKGTMPPQANLTDQQIADVLTYVYANWNNCKKKVTPAMVKALRGK